MILAIDLIPTHGGGQQVLYDLLSIARRSGNQVTAIVAHGGWLDRARAGNESLIAVPAPTRRRTSLLWRGIRFLRFCWTLFALRAKFTGASQIIVNDPELYLPAGLIAWLMGRKTVLYLHMAYRGASAFVVRAAAALPSVDRLVCVSHYVRQHTGEIIGATAARKLIVIENALPASAIDSVHAGESGDLSRIAIVGRLVPDKGQDVVLALARQLPECRFYLVGPMENADHAFVDRLRAECGANVSMAGYQHPIIEYLGNTRIGILLVPSRIPEACPLTPIEGAAAGCVVISRNLGGQAEVARNLGAPVVDDDAGFLSEIRRIRSLSQDELSALVQAARQRALSHYHPRRFEGDVLASFGWP